MLTARDHRELAARCLLLAKTCTKPSLAEQLMMPAASYLELAERALRLHEPATAMPLSELESRRAARQQGDALRKIRSAVGQEGDPSRRRCRYVSKYVGEIIWREAVSGGDMRQQAAAGTHSRVDRGHYRSGALSNSNSPSAPLSSLEPRRGR
jgi:hypothetical protein